MKEKEEVEENVWGKKYITHTQTERCTSETWEQLLPASRTCVVFNSGQLSPLQKIEGRAEGVSNL